jgi:hypothetical protein
MLWSKTASPVSLVAGTIRRAAWLALNPEKRQPKHYSDHFGCANWRSGRPCAVLQLDSKRSLETIRTTLLHAEGAAWPAGFADR